MKKTEEGKLKKEDILSFLITFIVGIFAGGFLYVTDFAAKVTEYSVPDVEEVSELSIVGDVYGGCRSACPSFQVQANGSYRYLYTPRAGADQVLRQGNLPIKLKRDLEKFITEKTLVQQSKPIEPLVCNSYSDGIDVVYKISLGGKDYLLDSCGSAVDSESDLWVTLGKIWDYYESLGAAEQ